MHRQQRPGQWHIALSLVLDGSTASGRDASLALAPAEFAGRRRQLMDMAGDDAVLLLAAAPERMRNADAAWPYRQDSDFHYLTSWPEPAAVLALLPGRQHGEAVMFCRERDAEYERCVRAGVRIVRRLRDVPALTVGGAAAKLSVVAEVIDPEDYPGAHRVLLSVIEDVRVMGRKG